MALLAVILSAVMATLVYYRNMADEMRREIVTEARYLEAGIELSGPAYLENLSGSIADTTRSRVTLVAEDGTVLYDNYAAAAGRRSRRLWKAAPVLRCGPPAPCRSGPFTTRCSWKTVR